MTISFNVFIRSLVLPPNYLEESWKVYHQILWIVFNLLVLGLTNLLYAVAMGSFKMTLGSFLELEISIILTGIIPICGIVFLRYYMELRNNLRLAQELNSQIILESSPKREPIVTETANDLITFVSENGKDKFTATAQQIYVVESVDNYVEIYWSKNGTITKTLLRNTLQRLDDQLKNHPSFFRCHRSYLVNLDKILSVEGNSQGYMLLFPNREQPVPVARSKNKELRALIYKE